MFEPRTTSGTGLNLKQKMVVIIMDILLLGELAFCIYLGKQDPEDMAGIFLRTFLPMMIGTVVMARVFIKKLRSEEQAFAVGLEEKINSNI
ncbi:MAG: hypothetical protein ABIG67_02550 [Pseudomonadota bacterium]